MTRILVVDDSEDARDLALAHLESAGYANVEIATSGEEALALLEREAAFDAVLLDVMMQGIDGIETCARIRADPRHADLPILMVTSLSDVESPSQAFVAGASDYIVKPVRRMELTARLRSALRLKAELDRRRAREAELSGPARQAQPLADPSTFLPDGEVLLAMLSTRPPGSGLVAVLLERADALGPSLAGARLAVTRALGAVRVPLGSVLADLGGGLFVALLPPGPVPAQVAESILRAVRDADLPTDSAGLSGRLRVSLGWAVAGREPRAALAAAVAAAERAAASGGDRVEAG